MSGLFDIITAEHIKSLDNGSWMVLLRQNIFIKFD